MAVNSSVRSSGYAIDLGDCYIPNKDHFFQLRTLVMAEFSIPSGAEQGVRALIDLFTTNRSVETGKSAFTLHPGFPAWVLVFRVLRIGESVTYSLLFPFSLLLWFYLLISGFNRYLDYYLGW